MSHRDRNVRVNRAYAIAAIAAALWSTPERAWASEVAWTGSGATSNWTNINNWFLFDRPDNDGETFVQFGAFPAQPTSTMNQSYWIKTLAFAAFTTEDAGYACTVNSSNDAVLSVVEGIVNMTFQSQVVNVPIKLTANATFRNGSVVGTVSYGALDVAKVDLNGNDLELFPGQNKITIAGPISGTGNLSVNNAGTALLTGVNTWKGKVILEKGRLIANFGSSLGSVENEIRFEPSEALSFPTLERGTSGAISIPVRVYDYEGRIEIPQNVSVQLLQGLDGNAQGIFAKSGAGTLVLTGASTGVGGTTVRGGTLQLSASNAASTGLLIVLSGATLALDPGLTQSVNTLNGFGTVQLGAGAEFSIGTGLGVAPDGSNAGTFGGSLSGLNVVLNKRGGSTLTLSGQGLYSGTTNVEGGVLAIDNQASGTSATGNSTVNVKSGARLAGDGAISGSVFIESGAELSPSDRMALGTGIGSLATGPLQLANGSRTTIEFSNSKMDRIDVTGNAEVSGTLQLVRDGIGELAPIGWKEQILSTTGTLNGRFASISGVSLSPTASMAVTYESNAAFATIADPGDVNLDRSTSFDDLLILAANYNDAGVKIWSTGDLTGDGATNFDDLLKLASRYNTTTLSAPLGWANATSLVPEPAVLSVVAGLAVVGLRRRRLSGRLR